MDPLLDLPTICAEHGIDKLRAQLDFSTYQIRPDSPPWVKSLADNAMSDLGVLGLLGPSGLSVAGSDRGRVRAELDPAALYVTGLTDVLRGKGQKLAIGLPPVARHLPLLLAGSAVLANTFDRARRLHRNGVLVVSPDLDVRSKYCDLFVGSEPLDAAHPGSRLKPSGERVMLRPVAAATEEGVCFFLPGLDLPPRAKLFPDLVVLDLRYSRWVHRTESLCKWVRAAWKSAGVVVLYTIGDRDTTTILGTYKFDDLPFDHQAVATCLGKLAHPFKPPRSGVVDWRLESAPRFLSRRHEVRLISQPEKVALWFQQIGDLLDQHKDRASADLNRARWLLAVLMQLPVPVSWYDGTAVSRGRSTLRRLIDHLGSRSRHDDGLGAVVQTLRMLFGEVLHQLEAHNPRADALRALVHALAGGSESRVQIIVRDRVAERALESWFTLDVLQDQDWLPQLEVQACPHYTRSSQDDGIITIVNGAFPRRYRWLAGGDLGRNVVFLAYAHEITVIERQLAFFYDKRFLEARAKARQRAISKLFSTKADPDISREVALPTLTLSLPPVPKSKTKARSADTQRGLGALKDLVEASKRADAELIRKDGERTWCEDASDDDSPDISLQVEVSSSEVPVDWIKVSVNSRTEGQRDVSFPPESVIDCIRIMEDDDLRRIRAGELKTGDVILLMGQDRRAGVFEMIVDLAECQPTMQYLAAFRRTWRVAVQSMVGRYRSRRGVDYRRLLNDLRDKGATVESEAAVRFWVEDHVIGPETVASIKAVGMVSGTSALVSQASQHNNAFRRLRGLRISIGHRLADLIRRSFKHLATGSEQRAKDHLDDRLGIPLDELLETIDIAEVIAISAAVQKSSQPTALRT